MTPTFPIDYNLIRKTLANETSRVTGLITVLEEPTYQGAPRPTNVGQQPYFSFKITTPGAKNGDDSQSYSGSGTIFGRGGDRKMTVSFHCYAVDQETAFNYMALWQGSLELWQTQVNLRAAGIAVWIIGTVADLSKLLNTGYEGRAQLDVQFGIVSNLGEDLGVIQTTDITGEVSNGDTETTVGPFIAP